MYTKEGWPQQVDAQLHPFFRRKLEITVECDCLMWGTEVIVPNKLQERILQELHAGHTGIVRMKCLARSRIGGQVWKAD